MLTAKNYIGIGCSNINVYVISSGKILPVIDTLGIKAMKEAWEGRYKGRDNGSNT